jgi:hypothetical protein
MSDKQTTGWQPIETVPPHAMFIGWDGSDGQPCLAFSHNGRVYWAHCIIADDAAEQAITHWQPLPEKGP